MNPLDPHADQPVVISGPEPAQARGAVIIVHGRGATAESMMSLADAMQQPDLLYLAPQAHDNTWYPFSFLAPIEQNEPGISSGLSVLGGLIEHLESEGIPVRKVALIGFSQGSCLISEFVARNAQRYGGVVLFSGGLMGPPGTPRDYSGKLDNVPVIIGCSDVDDHIPLTRVEETATVLSDMGAEVDKRIYSGMGHTVNVDELTAAGRLLTNLGS